MITTTFKISHFIIFAIVIQCYLTARHDAFLLRPSIFNPPKIVARKGGSSIQAAAIDSQIKHIPDLIGAHSLDHMEFYTNEVTAVANRFMTGLGMELKAVSDYSTGNTKYASHLMQSGKLNFLFTTPYPEIPIIGSSQTASIPSFDCGIAKKFIIDHGLAVKAIAIDVKNVVDAYNTMITNGARSVLLPTTVQDIKGAGYVEMAEVELYGDVTLRIVNKDHFSGCFLPNFQEVKQQQQQSDAGWFGLERVDHVVGNVWKLADHVQHIKQFTVSLNL